MNSVTLKLPAYGLLAMLLSSIATADLAAQRRTGDPHVAYAYPAGCERGKSCEVTVGGQNLKEATEVYVFGEGVKVEIVKWYRPMTSGEYNGLRNVLRDAREQLIEDLGPNTLKNPTAAEVAVMAGVTEVQLREMDIYRKRDSDPKRQPNDQLAEEATVRVTVAQDAEPGKHEMRFLTEGSISNPIWFRVGKWQEIRETEPNDIEPDDSIESLPVVINGQIMPGEKDRFSFEAEKGMKLVVEAGARDVIPYLADAVPGWFQAVMRITDSTGKEVSFADSFYYRQDPLLLFEVPKDDRYTVEIRDSLYRGREDFVYRITVGEIPYLTSIFPLGARVDSEVTVQLNGWNLTQNQLKVDTMSRRRYRPVRWLSVDQGNGDVVRFPLQVDYWPEVNDQEPNNDLSSPQTIKTRMTINGRIDHPGDRDVFQIEGSGRLVAEIQARRLGSPLDSILTVTDALGNEIAFNDDHKDLSQSLQTHHADSHLSVIVPSTGNYFLHVADAQNKGGEEFSYRLRMRAPQPDYELRVVPPSIIARAGQVVPITVFALRKDGFQEDIELSLVDPPEGFRIDGGVVPGDVDRIQLTLTVPETIPKQPITLEMDGAAHKTSRNRTKLVRPAIPAENMMQAFIWYHLVPVENWNVIISGKPGAKLPFRVIMPSSRLMLPREGEFILNVRPLSKNISVDQLYVQLYEPPPGITASIITNKAGAFAVRIDSKAEEVEQGLRGNLLMSVYKEYTPEKTEANPAPPTRRTDFGFLPAIPFEVTARKSTR